MKPSSLAPKCLELNARKNKWGAGLKEWAFNTSSPTRCSHVIRYSFTAGDKALIKTHGMTKENTSGKAGTAPMPKRSQKEHELDASCT